MQWGKCPLSQEGMLAPLHSRPCSGGSLTCVLRHNVTGVAKSSTQYFAPKIFKLNQNSVINSASQDFTCPRILGGIFKEVQPHRTRSSRAPPGGSVLAGLGWTPRTPFSNKLWGDGDVAGWPEIQGTQGPSYMPPGGAHQILNALESLKKLMS